MAKDERVKFRFVVRSADGRSSAEWVVWTGSRNAKPSDDVYIAPRSLGGEVKVSLHRDGTCLYKLTDQSNPRARLGDRHALERWTLEEPFPGTPLRRGLRLQFPENELVAKAAPSPATTVVPAPNASSVLQVSIVVSDAPFDLSDVALEIFALLDRANGGFVAVVGRSAAWDPEDFARQLARPRVGAGWEAPLVKFENDYGWVFSGEGSLFEFTEFALSRHAMGEKPATIDPFAGGIDWIGDSDLPAPYKSRDDLCGVVRVWPSGASTLYLDRRARCDHASLGRDAEEIRRSLEISRSDGIYDTLADGSMVSALMTRGLYRHGVDNDLMPTGHRMNTARFLLEPTVSIGRLRRSLRHLFRK